MGCRVDGNRPYAMCSHASNKRAGGFDVTGLMGSYDPDLRQSAGTLQFFVEQLVPHDRVILHCHRMPHQGALNAAGPHGLQQVVP